ncbi:AraC family transcriptional regulator [Curtobacterium sp. VKM Ac-2922]|uniref:AraC family transcriptional regulator n=1 Tax=Curtobacterium sp. VKM Ac-2922 TaxID=2929475 RepID=UPI001FB2CECC|nr:AraC family transcriptional regulator [Curtobacterium sp. VKM Ac-2922]MCJ1715012.1 helix-turn-helix domain-containing protein [Curtobacterium sp. VKM Ac-2922]
MSTSSSNGFRKQRFTDDDGSGYDTIFTSEYGGSDFASDTYVAPGTHYEYLVVGDDDLSLRTMRATGGRRTGVIGPREDHVVFWLAQGHLEMHFADRVRVVRPGSPYIASASEAYRFESEETIYNGVHLADAFLRRVGRELGYHQPEGPMLFEQQDEVIARREPLRRLIRELSPALMDDRVQGAMRTALNRRLAVVVLDTFPLRDRGDDVPVANRLRDAIRFIEEHARERPAVRAIADAAGLSERSLQDVFVRTLGVTPSRFLRDHRLDEARRSLLHGVGEGGVADVASAWGFSNPGRFATAYRERFAESPSATIRAARGPRPENGTVSARVRRALSFIEDHADEALTVERIADAAGVRPRRLQQLFQAECGTSPMARVRHVRAERAERNAADEKRVDH